MDNLSERIANLSQEKRRLLEELLRKRGVSASRLPITPRADKSSAPPLSFAQQRLWFLDQLEPGNISYNIFDTITLPSPLDITALKKSLNEIVGRHEILRTRFQAIDGKPVQVVAANLDVPLPVIDLSGLEEAEREVEASRLGTEEYERPFDLATGPLIRMTLVRLNEDHHVLLLTMHHIISDAWSLDLFYRELWTLYEAYSSGEESPLQELPIQYADYAVWQRQYLSGQVLEEQLSYWREQLEGAPPVLELPTDKTRPAMPSYRGAAQSLKLSKGLSDGLKALSQGEGVTLFMTLLAAFDLLLYRYTGQDDIVVGLPVAGRNRAEVEGLIGFFVNTLVLRTDLSGDPSFRQLIGRVREVALGAYGHQDLPFERLVEELQPERDMSRNPLFQVTFQLLTDSTAVEDVPDLTAHLSEDEADEDEFSVNVERKAAAFDLVFDMWESDGHINGRLEYSTDLFDESTIRRMLRHYEYLLEGIVAAPEKRLSELHLLSVEERHQLLVEWNDTECEYPRVLCLHQLFEAQAARTPEKIAVVYEDEQVSYRDLNMRANQLARQLQGLGVGPEVLVGVLAERSVEMVVALLGILKAGGAYVPLDPAYPKERLSFMMDDAQVTVLLTEERLLDGLPKSPAHVVCLGTESSEVTSERETEVITRVTPENPAYVIYTSGSTGKPKGVIIPHSALVNFLYSMRREINLGEDDTLLAVTTLSFDIAGLEIYLPLLVGARLLIADRPTAADPTRLLKLLVESGASVMQATPVTWQMLVETGWQKAGQPLKLLCGGEALSTSLAEQLRVRSNRLWNLYGPTETTIWSTCWRASDEVIERVPLGKPIDNTQVYVLDKHLEAVPMGVTGELYIGGDGLARGYLRRPELTAERFIPDPFGQKAGTRLYRTGDLARWLPSGELEYVGRVDHQVKVRGHRLELGEIEATLMQHPEISQAVALARRFEGGDVRLVAYLVTTSESKPSIGELQSYLQQYLPEYMIPSAFVMMERLPLTPNGKVDRRALPEPEHDRPELDNEYVAPRAPAEERLAEIWAEVLGLERVGVHDNFFNVGGHSLLATQINSRIRQAFQVELPLRNLFETPTIAGLAKSIEEIKANGGDLESLAIRRIPREQHRAKLSSQGVLEAPEALKRDPSQISRSGLNIGSGRTVSGNQS